MGTQGFIAFSRPPMPIAMRPSELEALAFLLPLSHDYPEIERWFTERVIPGVRAGTRTILTVYRDEAIAGLAIGKNEADEAKICTVRVAPAYVGRGMGLRLFDGVLRWLNVDKPHLTVSSNKLPQFERIFDWYDFTRTSSQLGRYLPGEIEHGYNELSN